MLTITDISKWQGVIDFVKMKAAGAVGVYIKASQSNWTDYNWLVNWQAAKDAGLLRGAFHYLDWGVAAQTQAEHFCSLLQNDQGEMPPCIDYEENNPPLDKVARLQDALSEVYSRFGRAMIYTGPSYWEAHGSPDPSWLKYSLWLAHWTTQANIDIPAPWTKWSIWQYTAKGPGPTYGVSSANIDLDYFDGTLDDLKKFCGLPVTIPSELYTVTANLLNVRSSPTSISTANIIGTLPKGEIIDVDNINSAGWAHFKPRDGFPVGGWCFKSYLVKYVAPVLTLEERVNILWKLHGL